MRASDQDREEAILALSDAFAEGRLDHREFEARMTSAQGATYLHDLDPLFDDLPPRRRTPEVARTVAPPGRLPRRPSFVPLLLGAALTVALVTGGHVWLVVPLWFLGLSMARRMAWRRHALAYAALTGHEHSYSRDHRHGRGGR